MISFLSFVFDILVLVIGGQKADDRIQMTEYRLWMTEIGIRKWEGGLRPIGACAYAPVGMRNDKALGTGYGVERLKD